VLRENEMGTPISDQNKIDACNDLGGIIVPTHIKRNFKQTSTILDVGAGWGKYRRLLPEYTNIDACEIWLPYIEQEQLYNQYRKVYHDDICGLHIDWYDAIIMGDVFEHIARENAVELLKNLENKCAQLYVVVPYQYHQGMVDDNPFEEHLQDDITDEIMQEFYHMKLLAKDDTKGVYIK
jgi:cyclopropane fatty-acyl-phospholipid synthase-like methyltransferase